MRKSALPNHAKPRGWGDYLESTSRGMWLPNCPVCSRWTHLPAASGITGVARTIGAAISPLFVGFLFAHPALTNVPFYIAGALKIIYDLLLYREFISLPPPEEKR